MKKKFVTILLLSMALLIPAAAKEGKEDPTIGRFVVVFDRLTNESLQAVEAYGARLETCLTKRMCLFRNEGAMDLSELVRELREEPGVREAFPYRKHHFQAY